MVSGGTVKYLLLNTIWEWCISPAVPKPPNVAPSVAPREEEVGWLKPKEAEPGPGWPEPCEKREELWEEELREEDP